LLYVGWRLVSDDVPNSGRAVVLIFRILIRSSPVSSAHVSKCFSNVPLIDGCALSVAVWERNRIVTTLATATWLANLAACLHCVFVSCRVWIHNFKPSSGVATARSIWVESLQMCGMLNVPRTKFSLLFIINTEFVLLILMLAGLLRWKSRGKGGLWHLLFTQVNPPWFHVG
jgi:hypothetical protein